MYLARDSTLEEISDIVRYILKDLGKLIKEKYTFFIRNKNTHMVFYHIRYLYNMR